MIVRGGAVVTVAMVMLVRCIGLQVIIGGACRATGFGTGLAKILRLRNGIAEIA